MSALQIANGASTRLPASYEQARIALAACDNIDECKDWSDKAAALAAYARMSDDVDLKKMAERIRARSERRLGELLIEHDARGGDRKSKKIKKGGANHFDSEIVSRKALAEAAGISVERAKRAVRVAKISQRRFEDAVESVDPPTVTMLAEMGKTSRGAERKGKSAARSLKKMIDSIASFCRENNPASVRLEIDQQLVGGLLQKFREVSKWMTEFSVSHDQKPARNTQIRLPSPTGNEDGLDIPEYLRRDR